MRKPGDRRDVLQALTIIAIGLALGGCGGTGQMRKAQDAFSEAARIENQQHMAPETLIIADPAAVGPAADLVDGQLDRASARRLYEQALAHLEGMDAQELEQLGRDHLLGAKMTLEALVYWRLGKFDEARRLAAAARAHADEQIYPRDRAMLNALPGLIKNDEAARKIAALEQGPESFQAVDALLQEAVVDLQSGRRLVGQGHPVNIYLIQAQLVAYKNMQLMYQHLHPTSRLVPEQVHEAAKDKLKELETSVQHAAGGQQLLLYWRGQLGISAD